MREIQLLSWNVNGIRAVQRKGFLEWFSKQNTDILCLQETKAHTEQLDAELISVDGYYSYWNYPERKGYSGVVLYTREEPQEVRYSFDNSKLDMEGRVVIAEYNEFTLMNIYFPNGKRDQERLDYKMAF